MVEYRDADGNERIVEATTSWCFVGAGLRLSMELLGPEYSMSINTLDAGPKVFFSREVRVDAGEDLVEKQNAEMGLMPIVSDEEAEYGYIGREPPHGPVVPRRVSARARTSATASTWPSCL